MRVKMKIVFTYIFVSFLVIIFAITIAKCIHLLIKGDLLSFIFLFIASMSISYVIGYIDYKKIKNDYVYNFGFFIPWFEFYYFIVIIAGFFFHLSCFTMLQFKKPRISLGEYMIQYIEKEKKKS